MFCLGWFANPSNKGGFLMMEDNDIMKTGKSISQFAPQSSLTGDEWLLVNVKTNPQVYVSRKVRLSTLRDYIISNNLITEDGIDIALCDENDTLIAYD